MSAQPHSTWADVYDLAYERSFGDFYSQLTQATIQLVEEIVNPPAMVVDFGAGTGRLSIPLAELGFEITAVDPCLEMLSHFCYRMACGRFADVNFVQHSNLSNQ
jgi:2-polyprenyl-3-methyl-5-hydroxy-6-metoxy-1,4-benzoquinol methylase